MIQTTVKISGMACSMCEAHINDAIRAAFPVEKVSASHSKGEAVIVSREPLDAAALQKVINDTGYTAEYGDRLLTLSTCEYTHTNGRFVVVAKLISE